MVEMQILVPGRVDAAANRQHVEREEIRNPKPEIRKKFKARMGKGSKPSLPRLFSTL
jgi:hypothetical protein